MKKTYRIKTNNQELLIRKQNESDATSRWIEFQKTRPIEALRKNPLLYRREKGIKYTRENIKLMPVLVMFLKSNGNDW